MIRFTGGDALRRKLKKKGVSVDAAMTKALYQGGLFIQRESQKLVPVDTGELKRSASTRVDPLSGRPSVIVGYGTEYGVYVHENLEARHLPGKTSKFLEGPLIWKRDLLKLVIKDALRSQAL